MKISSLLLCLSLLFLAGCTEVVGPTRQEDILSDRIILIVSERLNKKHGFRLSCIGGAADKEGVWEIAAGYGRYGTAILDIAEARELILDCAKEFLDEANHDEAFRPYMKVYPFTSTNLGLTIINYDESGREIVFPYISTIGLHSGDIYYRSLDSDVMQPYARIIEETYEEDVALSKKQQIHKVPDEGTQQ